jgi:hypothetical protein
LTYAKYAADPGAISEYPGAAGPVSGWWLPIVMVVAVMPGAEAVRAALELLLLELEPEPEPELELELLLEHAATASAVAVMMAAACQRSRWDLFMKCLPSHVGWPAFRRPKA